MAKTTIWFGVLLLVVGMAAFVLTGSAHPTSLIPCGFGLLLVVCGVLALTEDPKRRMLWMHIAVTVGLLGWVFPLIRVIAAAAKDGVTLVPSTAHAAMLEQEVMILLCFVFTVLCVMSFIAARRARTA